ncbi:hypothetical protein JVU11DRAFT_11772 [Chiua virens]|nr:hypothetical protein JVU11DRAFT_11772 [Chiua virens]
MLMLLVHHKLTDALEALGLKELEVREKMLQVAVDLIGLDKVQSQSRMIALCCKFIQEHAKMFSKAQGL